MASNPSSPSSPMALRHADDRALLSPIPFPSLSPIPTPYLADCSEVSTSTLSRTSTPEVIPYHRTMAPSNVGDVLEVCVCLQLLALANQHLRDPPHCSRRSRSSCWRIKRKTLPSRSFALRVS
jgi:hypothetical protein